MALKYRGDGTPQEIRLVIYGDGTSSSIDIDLSKAPFCIDFKGKVPSLAYLVGEDTPESHPDVTTVSISSGTPPNSGLLRVAFASPPPAAVYGRADEVGVPSGAVKLAVRFIYG